MRNRSVQTIVMVFMIFALSACSRLESLDNVLGGFFSFLEKEDSNSAEISDNSEVKPRRTINDVSELDNKDKLMIDKWLTDQDLNRYGDPKDTIYLGGTPLFDETTGKSIDRFEYIFGKHPNILDEIQ